MAVKVLHMGVIPENRTYETHCIKCRTSFQFLGSDGKFIVQNDKNLVLIECPLCKNSVTTIAWS